MKPQLDFADYNKGKEAFVKLFSSPKTKKIFEPTYHAVKRVLELGHKRNPKILPELDSCFINVKRKIDNEERLKFLALFAITYPIHCAFDSEWANKPMNKQVIGIIKQLHDLAHFTDIANIQSKHNKWANIKE